MMKVGKEFTLKVARSNSQDEERRTVRVSKAILEKIGLIPGDIVEIKSD
jgi:hypothetical protein